LGRKEREKQTQGRESVISRQMDTASVGEPQACLGTLRGKPDWGGVKSKIESRNNAGKGFEAWWREGRKKGVVWAFGGGAIEGQTHLEGGKTKHSSMGGSKR